MAYNNYFPMGYQQQYYPQSQQQAQPQMPMMNQQAQMQQQPVQAQPQQMSNSIIWVQGEAGAKSYLVAPNTTVQLWDSENQVIYLKSADASGMPSMKILDYKIRETAQPIQQLQVVNNPTPVADYVTRDELTAFEAQIREQIASLTPATATRKTATKKEEKTDE